MVFGKSLFYLSLIFIFSMCSPEKNKSTNSNTSEKSSALTETSIQTEASTLKTKALSNTAAEDDDPTIGQIPEAVKLDPSDSKAQLEKKLASIKALLEQEAQKVLIILETNLSQFAECKKTDKEAKPLVTKEQIQQLKEMSSEDLVAYLLELLSGAQTSTDNDAPKITILAGSVGLLVASAGAAAASHNYYKSKNKTAGRIAGIASIAAIGGSACVATRCINLIDNSSGACAEVNNATSLALKKHILTIGNLDGEQKAIQDLLSSK